MLSNAYFLAKFRFDTAENEPAKNLQIFEKCIFENSHADLDGAADEGDSDALGVGSGRGHVDGVEAGGAKLARGGNFEALEVHLASSILEARLEEEWGSFSRQPTYLIFFHQLLVNILKIS